MSEKFEFNWSTPDEDVVGAPEEVVAARAPTFAEAAEELDEPAPEEEFVFEPEVPLERRDVISRANRLGDHYPKLSTIATAVAVAAAIQNVYRPAEAPHEETIPTHEGARAPEIKKEVKKNILEETGEGGHANISFEIKGFEGLNLSYEDVRGILTQTIPQGFGRNFDSIEYMDRSQKMYDKYGPALASNSEAAGEADRIGRDIRIFKAAKDDSAYALANDVILHEACHFQDWMSNRLLNQNEKDNLQKKVTERVQADGRFNSSYVEKIQNKDRDKEVEVKAVEYFAEICAAYLSGGYNLLPEADKVIVRDLIKKIDPDFKRGEALRKRDAIVGFALPLHTYAAQTEEEIRADVERLWPEVVERLVKRAVAQGEVESEARESILKLHDTWAEGLIGDFRDINKKGLERADKDNREVEQRRYQN